MHAAFQIDLLLRVVRGKLGSKHDPPDVCHVHRFLINKLEHLDFVGSRAKWNAVAWDSRCSLFATIVVLGITNWMVCPD